MEKKVNAVVEGDPISFKNGEDKTFTVKEIHRFTSKTCGAPRIGFLLTWDHCGGRHTGLYKAFDTRATVNVVA